MADYSLTPTIAIVDPALVESVPAFIAADTGMDVLTHATEAYTSNFANDYTDGIALQTIKLVFKYLEKSVKQLTQKPVKRCIMPLQWLVWPLPNAFLGMSHSMAHKIGAVHHTVHGRTNAILLPYVIRYNGTRPSKTTTWPKYTITGKLMKNSKISLVC